MRNEWTWYSDCEIRRQVCEEQGYSSEECAEKFEECRKMSIDEATPKEWDKASKTVYGKLMHPNDTATAAPNGAINRQVGGNHYNRYEIQPVDFIIANKLDWCEANAVKYITRWKDKNGVEDLRKAIHYIEMLIQREIQ